MQFEDLRLTEPLRRALRDADYVNPTPIQSAAIPHILAGRDVLGSAQTGTGKTAAFALPILQRLSDPALLAGKAKGRIRALVVCPTRELAQQIHESFQTYGRHTKVRPVVIFGGVKQGAQARALRDGADVLVATPGRLLDLINQGLVSLSGIEILVLDEADRMLDMGFIPDIRRILACMPAKRQTLLFSATMPAPIRKLAEDILHHPVAVAVSPVSSAPASVAHSVYHVEQPDKARTLSRFLTETPHTRALVFTRTKHGANKLTKYLLQAGIRAAAIHGNKTQGARTRALAEFRSAETPVLVATDLAARGLDVDDISHVINYDLTHQPETYVHRIGRTGRAGATGTAVSFCTREDRDNLRAIEKMLGAPLKRANEPTTAAPMPGDAPQRTVRATPRQSPPARRPQSAPPAGRNRWRSERAYAGR